jgi:hypothetical protein
MSIRRVFKVLASTSICFALPVAACGQTFWNTPLDGDWYDATNWTNLVPTAGELTGVNAGGTATADRSSPLYVADPVSGDMTIGVRFSPTLAPPISTGGLELVDVNLDASGPLLVGYVSTPAGMFHNATGTFTSTAGANAHGNVNVDGDASIGHVNAGPAATMAVGTVDLAGDLTGDGSGDLMVGQTAEAGTANGTATVAGDIAGFGHVFVGRTNLTSTGNATGTLTVDGSVTASTMGVTHEFDIGTQAGDGTSLGTAEVGQGIFDFDFVAVGSGSTQGAAGASGTGTLDVLAGGIHTTDGFEFAVGGTNGPGDVFGTVVVTSGGVSGYDIVDIGYVRQQDTTGNASGILNIFGGGLAGNHTNDLIVGQTAGSGNADGTTFVTGNVTGYRHVFVGRSNLMSTGDAFGTLTVTGSVTAATMATTHEFTVGSQAGDGFSNATVQVSQGIFGFDFVAVGSGSTQGIAGAGASGRLDVLSGGIHTTDGFEFAVGGTNGPGDVDGTVHVFGGVSGYGIVDVGHVRQANTTGNASGILEISLDLDGTHTGDLIVGQTAGSGTGDGTVSVVGDVSGYRHVHVGRTNLMSTGDAMGDLAVGGSISAATMGATHEFTVGTQAGDGDSVAIVDVNEGIFDFDFIAVGSGSTQGIAGASGDGRLFVRSGGIHTTGGFEFAVGGTNGPGNVDGIVTVAGGVSGYSLVDIGYSRQNNTTGEADGRLEITSGGLSGNGTNNLIIGRAAGSGFAFGAVSVTGNVNGFLDIEVGFAEAGSTVNAGGLLELFDSVTTADNMRVATDEGAGAALGLVVLERSLIDLAGDLTLGPASGLIFRLDGLQRGTQYGAIDAENAALDGLANIRFEFTPSFGTHEFDLIVSGTSNGILGDFDAGGVSITDLPAAFTATTGIVLDQVGGQTVEIYRLTISAVPEPTTALLACLAALAILARRRKPG